MVKWKSHYAHKSNIFGQNWPLTLVNLNSLVEVNQAIIGWLSIWQANDEYLTMRIHNQHGQLAWW